MKQLEPLNLKQAQLLVDDAIKRSQKRHSWWRQLEFLYRTGRTSFGLSATSVAGTIWDNLGPDDLEAVNLILPRMNLRIASAVSRDPQPNAVPYDGGQDAEFSARVANALLAWAWDRTHAMNVMRDMTQDAVVIGNGFAKVGYVHTEKEMDRHPDDVKMHLEAAVQLEMQQAAREGRDPAKLEDIQLYVPTTVVATTQDECFVQYVRPYDMFFDPLANRIENARWIAQRLVLPVDEIKANPVYKDIEIQTCDAGQPDAGHILNDTEKRVLGGEASDDAMDYATVYEFYDMRTHTMKAFQLGAKEALFEGEIPYSNTRPPFVHLVNYRDGGSELWGFGDIENIAGLQLKINEIHTMIVDNYRRTGRKYLAKSGILSDEAIESLESDEDDLVVVLNQTNDLDNINNAIVPFNRTPLPSDVWQSQTFLQNAMDQVSGTNDIQNGGSGSDRQAATTTAAMQGIADLRSQDLFANVDTAAGDIMALMLLLMKEFMTEKRVIRVVGSRGTAWADISGDDIVGEFDVEVGTSSMRSQNANTEFQKGQSLLQSLAQLAAVPGINVQGGIREAFIKMGFDPDSLNLFPAPPAPTALPPNPNTMPPQGPGLPPQPSEADKMQALGGPPVPANTSGDVAI